MKVNFYLSVTIVGEISSQTKVNKAPDKTRSRLPVEIKENIHY